MIFNIIKLKEVKTMAIKRKYQKTAVLGEQFLRDTGNQYIVVSVRNYVDKKGRLPDGVQMTLQITEDHSQYPATEDDMVLETFDVTVLTGTHNVGLVKGDRVSLHDFLPDNSYYIDFNYILRFGGVKKIADPNKK
jgi:hypothetical protein